MKKLKNKIVKAIALCEYELKNREKGIFGESSVEQLKIIINELNQVLNKLENENFSKSRERFLYSFANAFTVWGWNMQNPTELFVLLTEINNEYKNL